MKNPNGASENDKGSSHLKKNLYRVGFELLLMKRRDHHPIESLAQISNVDSPLRNSVLGYWRDLVYCGVDNRKRGLRKMLDIKEHEE